MRYEPKLDGMRSYAALAVIGMHWHELLPFGWIGVQFFFVLSGYLITSILLAGMEKPGAKVSAFFVNFFRRRALRLLPLYYTFTIVLVLAGMLMPNSGPLWRELPFILTYTLNIARMFPGYATGQPFTHLWSLCVEWQFYLIWPFILWWAGRRRSFSIAIALVVAAPLIRIVTDALAAMAPVAVDLRAYYRAYVVYDSPLSHLDAFAFGALLVTPSVRELLGRRSIRLGILGVVAAVGSVVILASRKAGYAGVLSLGFPPGMAHFGEKIWGYSILNCASAAAIAWALQDGRLQKWLFGNAAAVYLGTISYGIYIWHFPIVLFLMSVFGPAASGFGPRSLIGLLSATSVTVAIAACSYAFIEKPFLKMKTRAGSETPSRTILTTANQTR